MENPGNQSEEAVEDPPPPTAPAQDQSTSESSSQPQPQERRPPPPLSPLTGSYLLIVVGEPHSERHKEIILQKIAKAFLSWDVSKCHVSLEKELQVITSQSPEGEEARYGERLIQYATENLVTEILIHPQLNTLHQCLKNLLSSFTKHRHIIHAGYTFAGNGSWILQDGTLSISDLVEALHEPDVLRVLKAYENSVSIDVHCAPEGDWTTERFQKEPVSKLCNVRINPGDVMTAGNPAILAFIDYLFPFLEPANIQQLLQPTDVVGNIRFTHPTLYVFPGGQGDAALFGINGFNMLIDGGFARKACFWDFARHLDRLDAVLLTRLNNSTVNGISAVLQRKKMNHVYPQIGHFFCNLQDRKIALSPDGDKDKDSLIVSLAEEGQEIVANLRHLALKPHPCYRDGNQVDPVNLYHKVGHGKLDMYVISPARDSQAVKEFLAKWSSNDCHLFSNTGKKLPGKSFEFPLQNLVSICALLVWQPANPNDTITRILFPGSTPQHKIFEGLEKLRHLEFLKHPVCSAKSISPSVSTTTVTRSLSKTRQPKAADIKQKETKVNSKPQTKPARPKVEKMPPKELKSKLDNKLADEKNGLENVEEPLKKLDNIILSKDEQIENIKKEIQKMELAENEEQKKKIVHRSKYDMRNVKSKVDSRAPSKSIDRKKASEKKPESENSPPGTPKKSLANGSATKTEKAKVGIKAAKVPSPTSTPAKSAKEANNRKVVEARVTTRSLSKSMPKKKEETPPPPSSAVAKTERKQISRRPKAPLSPAKSSAEKPKAEPEPVLKAVKKKTEVDTTVIKSVSQTISKELQKGAKTEKTEENEKEVEIKKLEEETTENQETDTKAVKNELRSAQTERNEEEEEEEEEEEYLIITKEEYGEESAKEDESGKENEEEIQTKDETEGEGEIKKLLREEEESEKKREIHEKTDLQEEEQDEKQGEQKEEETDINQTIKEKIANEEENGEERANVTETKRSASPGEKTPEGRESELQKLMDVDEGIDLKEPASKEHKEGESLPEEKMSNTLETSATTAPTLPEDERIEEPAEQEKGHPEDVKEVIEEKYIQEKTKEEKHEEALVESEQPDVPMNIGIEGPSVLRQLNQRKHPRDVVKTPDEVAELPVHEEVDPRMYSSGDFTKELQKQERFGFKATDKGGENFLNEDVSDSDDSKKPTEELEKKFQKDKNQIEDPVITKYLDIIDELEKSANEPKKNLIVENEIKKTEEESIPKDIYKDEKQIAEDNTEKLESEIKTVDLKRPTLLEKAESRELSEKKTPEELEKIVSEKSTPFEQERDVSGKSTPQELEKPKDVSGRTTPHELERPKDVSGKSTPVERERDISGKSTPQEPEKSKDVSGRTTPHELEKPKHVSGKSTPTEREKDISGKSTPQELEKPKDVSGKSTPIERERDVSGKSTPQELEKLKDVSGRTTPHELERPKDVSGKSTPVERERDISGKSTPQEPEKSKDVSGRTTPHELEKPKHVSGKSTPIEREKDISGKSTPQELEKPKDVSGKSTPIERERDISGKSTPHELEKPKDVSGKSTPIERERDISGKSTLHELEKPKDVSGKSTPIERERDISGKSTPHELEKSKDVSGKSTPIERERDISGKSTPEELEKPKDVSGKSTPVERETDISGKSTPHELEKPKGLSGKSTPIEREKDVSGKSTPQEPEKSKDVSGKTTPDELEKPKDVSGKSTPVERERDISGKSTPEELEKPKDVSGKSTPIERERDISGKSTPHELEKPKGLSGKSTPVERERDVSGKSTPQELEKPKDVSGRTTPHELEKAEDVSGKTTPHELEKPKDVSGKSTPQEPEKSKDVSGRTTPDELEKPKDVSGKSTPVERERVISGKSTPRELEKPKDVSGKSTPIERERDISGKSTPHELEKPKDVSGKSTPIEREKDISGKSTPQEPEKPKDISGKSTPIEREKDISGKSTPHELEKPKDVSGKSTSIERERDVSGKSTPHELEKPKGLSGKSTPIEHERDVSGKSTPHELEKPKGLSGKSTPIEHERDVSGKSTPQELEKPKDISGKFTPVELERDISGKSTPHELEKPKDVSGKYSPQDLETSKNSVPLEHEKYIGKNSPKEDFKVEVDGSIKYFPQDLVKEVSENITLHEETTERSGKLAPLDIQKSSSAICAPQELERDSSEKSSLKDVEKDISRKSTSQDLPRVISEKLTPELSKNFSEEFTSQNLETEIVARSTPIVFEKERSKRPIPETEEKLVSERPTPIKLGKVLEKTEFDQDVPEKSPTLDLVTGKSTPKDLVREASPQVLGNKCIEKSILNDSEKEILRESSPQDLKKQFSKESTRQDANKETFRTPSPTNFEIVEGSGKSTPSNLTTDISREFTPQGLAKPFSLLIKKDFPENSTSQEPLEKARRTPQSISNSSQRSTPNQLEISPQESEKQSSNRNTPEGSEKYSSGKTTPEKEITDGDSTNEKKESSDTRSSHDFDRRGKEKSPSGKVTPVDARKFGRITTVDIDSSRRDSQILFGKGTPSGDEDAHSGKSSRRESLIEGYPTSSSPQTSQKDNLLVEEHSDDTLKKKINEEEKPDDQKDKSGKSSPQSSETVAPSKESLETFEDKYLEKVGKKPAIESSVSESVSSGPGDKDISGKSTPFSNDKEISGKISPSRGGNVTSDSFSLALAEKGTSGTYSLEKESSEKVSSPSPVDISPISLDELKDDVKEKRDREKEVTSESPIQKERRKSVSESHALGKSQLELLKYEEVGSSGTSTPDRSRYEKSDASLPNGVESEDEPEKGILESERQEKESQILDISSGEEEELKALGDDEDSEPEIRKDDFEGGIIFAKEIAKDEKNDINKLVKIGGGLETGGEQDSDRKTVVKRMLVTASSEDGGTETEICIKSGGKVLKTDKSEEDVEKNEETEDGEFSNLILQARKEFIAQRTKTTSYNSSEEIEELEELVKGRGADIEKEEEDKEEDEEDEEEELGALVKQARRELAFVRSRNKEILENDSVKFKQKYETTNATTRSTTTRTDDDDIITITTILTEEREEQEDGSIKITTTKKTTTKEGKDEGTVVTVSTNFEKTEDIKLEDEESSNQMHSSESRRSGTKVSREDGEGKISQEELTEMSRRTSASSIISQEDLVSRKDSAKLEDFRQSSTEMSPLKTTYITSHGDSESLMTSSFYGNLPTEDEMIGRAEHLREFRKGRGYESFTEVGPNGERTERTYIYGSEDDPRAEGERSRFVKAYYTEKGQHKDDEEHRFVHRYYTSDIPEEETVERTRFVQQFYTAERPKPETEGKFRFVETLSEESIESMDFAKAIDEHISARGEYLGKDIQEDAAKYVNGKTKEKTDEKASGSETKTDEEKEKDVIAGWGKPLGLPLPPKNLNKTYAFHGQNISTTSTLSTPTDNSDSVSNWGHPMNLPSPVPPPTVNGTAAETLPAKAGNTAKETPKKEKKVQPKKNVSGDNKSSGTNTPNRRSESPVKQVERRTPSTVRNNKSALGTYVYLDLTYVPHHGNSYYSNVEFFKKVRARYYVFSGTEPSKEVYDALLEAKQTWEDKKLEVTIIPTYDTDVLGYWVAENEEILAKHKIDLSPSASRCTINLQDHETSCSAYRLEF